MLADAAFVGTSTLIDSVVLESKTKAKACLVYVEGWT